MIRKLHFYILGISSLIVLSCTKSYELDHELDNGISLEAYLNQNYFAGLVWSNNDYPCFTDLCKPLLLRDLEMYIVDDENNETLISATDGVYTQDLVSTIEEGEIVGIRILNDGKLYRAASRMPAHLDVILDAEYVATGTLPGLHVLIDRSLLRQANGIYLQFLAFGKNNPYFGYLLHDNPERFATLPHNGVWISEDVYYIPESTLQLSNLHPEEGDITLLSSIHLSPESVIFYEEFKWEIINSALFLSNDQLTFAPADALPTNVLGEAFGFFHVYYEQVLQDTIK